MKLYISKFSLSSWSHETFCRRCAMNKIIYSVYSYLCLFSLNNYCRHARVMCLWLCACGSSVYLLRGTATNLYPKVGNSKSTFSSSRHDSNIVLNTETSLKEWDGYQIFGVTKIRSLSYSESPRLKSWIGNRLAWLKIITVPPFCRNQLSSPLILDYNSFLL